MTIHLCDLDFRVLLDTGSSDLWVYSPNRPLTILNDSHVATNASYGTGSVSGTIHFAELRFGEFVIPSQGEDLDIVFPLY